MFCSKCDAQIADGSRFCGHCGANLESGNQSAQQQNYEPPQQGYDVPQSGYGQPQPEYYVPPQQGDVPPRPGNLLAWSILSTIFCCVPFGIVAIVYSAKVNPLWDFGDFVGAKDAADKARTWNKVSLVLGIIGSIIYAVCLIWLAD
jgi:hypothetical protein